MTIDFWHLLQCVNSSYFIIFAIYSVPLWGVLYSHALNWNDSFDLGATSKYLEVLYADHMEALRSSTIFLCVMVLGICGIWHIMAKSTDPGTVHNDYNVFPQQPRTLSFILMARMIIHFHKFHFSITGRWIVTPTLQKLLFWWKCWITAILMIKERKNEEIIIPLQGTSHQASSSDCIS